MFLIRMIELMDLSPTHSWYCMDFYYKCGAVKDWDKCNRYFFVNEW